MGIFRRNSTLKKFATLAAMMIVMIATPLFAQTIAPPNGGGIVGGGPSYPMFSLFIHGLPGWEYQTGSSIEALIDPPFYNDGESNMPFNPPAHSENFTTAYWVLGGQKLTIQSLAHPNAVGDMPFEGKIEVGANDTRTTLTMDWWTNIYQSPLSWYAAIYSIDTRSRVFSMLHEPSDGRNMGGTITVPMSRAGYDVFVVAYDATAPVPEPSSFMALGSGLLGLGGLALRRLK